MEIRKTLDLQASDFMEFISQLYKKLYVIIPAATVLLFAGVNLLSKEFSLPSMIFPAAVAAVFPLGLFLYMKNASKKALVSFTSANGTLNIVVNETGIKTTGKMGETSLAWRDMYKLIETKNTFFFYIQKANAIVLPKRQLNADELSAILSVIKKEADPKKARLLSKSLTSI